MLDPAKPETDVRPYAVRDALEPAPAHPRVVIHTSPSAAVSHVVGARFTASALNAMEVLALTAQGVIVEDPRNVLPVLPSAPYPEQVAEQPAAQPSLPLSPYVSPFTGSEASRA